MAEANAALVIIGLGVLWVVGLTSLTILRAQSLQRTANRLVELALGGRADEARILARNANLDFSMVLDALNGQLARPRRSFFLKDILLVSPIALPAVVLTIYGMAQLRGPPNVRLNGVTVLLFGFAVLLPVTFAAALAILGVRRNSTRMVRGSYVTLLARNVKTTVDAEITEAIRRSNPIRDPRGD